MFTAVNLAAIYALIAIGIALVWAGLGFLNIAHGAMFAVGAYGGWWTVTYIADAGVVALLGGMIAGAASGLFVYFTVYLPLQGRRNWQLRMLLGSLALYMIGTNALQAVFGPETKNLPGPFGDGSVRVFDTVVAVGTIGSMATAAFILALLIGALKWTRIGLGVRAISQNQEGALLVGINRKLLAIGVLVSSGLLVGLASVLLSQIFFVSPNAGFTPLIKGMIVALLGGLGSIPGTLVAACLIGLVEALTATYVGGEYVIITLFLLIGVVLLIRPRGIGGLLEESRA